MTPKSIIELIELTKIYGAGEAQITALDTINLSITTGEFVAIMGASGSGKSTLMNILGCLDRPTRGKYLLAGEDVADLSGAARGDPQPAPGFRLPVLQPAPPHQRPRECDPAAGLQTQRRIVPESRSSQRA